ncbi:MAG: sulfatase-like hydrolase/transferase [Myxococcota bacterium]
MRYYFIALLSSILLSCTNLQPSEPVEVAEGAKRHAVVLVIDTLRSDVVSTASTPNIDSLVDQGAQAVRAWSSSTWTAPSVISIMTGKSIREHGWDYPMPAKMRARGESYPPIPTTTSTLAEVLRRKQFTNIGYYANPLLRRELGFDRGFDEWSFSTDSQMAKKIRQKMQNLDPQNERYLFYIHLIGPHHPLRPSVESRQRWNVDEKLLSKRRQGLSLKSLKPEDAYGIANYKRAYHAVVEDTDKTVGQILKALKPILNDSVLILTSDHGEMLGEHQQLGHQAWVYEPLTHVPFVAVGAPELPNLINNAVVADAVTKGLKIDANWDVTIDQQRPLYAQREGKVAISEDGRIKGIWDEGIEVYDLLNDPGELKSIDIRQNELRQIRIAFERAYEAGTITDDAVEISNEMEDALKSLGYIDE